MSIVKCSKSYCKDGIHYVDVQTRDATVQDIEALYDWLASRYPDAAIVTVGEYKLKTLRVCARVGLEVLA